MTITIGKLAKAAGVKIDTIRYYERQGLIEPARRTEAGYRQFDRDAIRRVMFIRTAQSVGFTLSEIMRLINFDGSSQATAADVLKATEAKIEAHTKKMQELRKLKKTLMHIAQLCPGDETPASECPILDFFYPDDATSLLALKEIENDA
ncbi:MAG: heavy metal-responsive transcriptional regulator [Rhodospirillaceae bacterium]|jgi:DNA-binding transcriptional MerR regulator